MTNRKRNILDTKLASAIISLLVVFSVLTFSIETLPDLSREVLVFLDVSEIFVVTVFTAEYLYRLYVAKDRLRFATSFYGIIDLLAILPYVLSLAFDLRALRLMRVLRLLRIFKLVRYSAALSRMGRAFNQSKEELIISVGLLSVVIYLAAYGIYQFEHAAQPDKFASIVDALWWAVATVTTVGYGDIYPITIAGRLFTFIVLITSLGLVAIPTGIFASALFAVKSEGNVPTSSPGDDGVE